MDSPQLLKAFTDDTNKLDITSLCCVYVEKKKMLKYASYKAYVFDWPGDKKCPGARDKNNTLHMECFSDVSVFSLLQYGNLMNPENIRSMFSFSYQTETWPKKKPLYIEIDFFFF